MTHRVPERLVYYISDGTGITAETIGHSLLTQFGGLRFDTRRLSFIDNEDKARAAATQVREQGRAMDCRPIIISSVVNEALAVILAESGALVLDVFGPFVGRLETELGQQSERRVGHAHGMVDFAAYEERINATNYALTTSPANLHDIRRSTFLRRSPADAAGKRPTVRK